MLTRASRRAALLIGIVVACAIVRPAAGAAQIYPDAANLPDGEYFASLNAWHSIPGANRLHIGVEAGISPTGERGVSLTVYQYPVFSGNCYVSPATLTVDYSLIHGYLHTSCVMYNSFEVRPTPYRVTVDVTWKGRGQIAANLNNGARGRKSDAILVATVTGPSGKIINVNAPKRGGYLSFIPVQVQ